MIILNEKSISKNFKTTEMKNFRYDCKKNENEKIIKQKNKYKNLRTRLCSKIKFFSKKQKHHYRY